MLDQTESPEDICGSERHNGGLDTYCTFSIVPTKTADVRKIKGWQKKTFTLKDKDETSLTVFKCQRDLERIKLKCQECDDSTPLESCTATTRNTSDFKRQMELENQEKTDISNCLNIKNTVEQGKGVSDISTGLTEFKRNFSYSFGSDSNLTFCKKIKLDFPANVYEVFSENFICGDSKKSRADVTVGSQSAFVSEELHNFLTSYSKLNIDYEIPQLEAADHISHDEVRVMFPLDVQNECKVSILQDRKECNKPGRPKSDLYQQNMFVKLNQSNTQVQRTDGTTGPKAKTLAEKRRLLEEEMKLSKSKNLIRSIKGNAVGTEPKAKTFSGKHLLKQEMRIKLRKNEKKLIQRIKGFTRKRGKHFDSINNNIIERRSHRLLACNNNNVDVYNNENRLPNLKRTCRIKEEDIVDKTSNAAKEKPVKKKVNKKLKKADTHIMLFQKQELLPRRINEDFGLCECNIAEEISNLKQKTSEVGMILNIGLGRHLYEEAVHNLELIHGDNVVKESAAKFAACAVIDRTATVTVKRILVPVVCNKLINLMYQTSGGNRIDHFNQSIKNELQFENHEENLYDDLDDQNIVEDEVVCTVVDLIKYVEQREFLENFDRNISYDPDVPEPVVTRRTRTDYAGKYVKPTNKHVGNKVASQLNKLGVTWINFNEELNSNERYRQRVCSKEYCIRGCVCESLQVLPRQPTHCGNFCCIFEIKCSCSLYDKLKEKLSPSILRIQTETVKKMAKEEKKYHNTVIMSQDKVVYIESDKRKREIKLPVKYRDDIIILSEDEELLSAECVSFNPKKRLTDKTAKNRKPSPVKPNNLPVDCSDKSVRELFCNIKPCYVALEKIDTKGAETVCLSHYLCNRFCFNSSEEDKSYVKNCEAVSRNVAKKKTSGVMKKTVKKCRFCVGKCMCSANNYQAGFGVIQEVKSLEPEEFYGNMSDTAGKSSDAVKVCSKGNLGCRRLCNKCKLHSNTLFMCDILSSATAPLPVVHAPCKWWVIELESDDSMVIRNTFMGIDVPYTKLFEAVKKASSRRCTVSLLLKGNKKNKYVHHDRYGAYAVPELVKIIFFGPYAINEQHDLKAFRLITAKATVGVPFLIANKQHSFSENKNHETVQKNVMSVCDMCKQHFDYGVNSVWWYSESCRKHLMKKSSEQLTKSDHALVHHKNVGGEQTQSDGVHHENVGGEQTQSDGGIGEDVIVMETLDVVEHGVDLIKNEVQIDEVDDFIIIEEKELQNLMDEHILDDENKVISKDDGKEFQNITNKRHLLSYNVIERKSKEITHMPCDVTDSKRAKLPDKNIVSSNKKINNKHCGNNNELTNGTKAVSRKKIVMNKVYKKLDKIDSDRYMRSRMKVKLGKITETVKNMSRISATHPRGGKMQQNGVVSTTELQNGEVSKDFNHCPFTNEKEKNITDLPICVSVNESQELLNDHQAGVNNTPHAHTDFTSSNMPHNSSSSCTTEKAVSNYACEEVEVIDCYDYTAPDYCLIDENCSIDENDEKPTDSDDSDEDIVLDSSDPHLILHKPKRKLQLHNFGAKITKSVLCMERSPSECESLPKAVLFCELHGIDAIPVIEYDENKLVIEDPLNQTVRHQFQHSVYASKWLQKLFLRCMVFTDEVKLSWSLIKSRHLIAKLPFFNPKILTDIKLVVTPSGIEELAGVDIDDLKKQRYRTKFECNRKRLAHLVMQKQEFSNVNVYTLLTKATAKVKQITEKSIEITCNLSYLGRRNRQLKSRLYSLLAGLDPETQQKAKKLIREVKYQELMKHFYSKGTAPSGQTVKKLEKVNLEANDDGEDSDVEVVSVHVPEFEQTEKTVSSTMKRTRAITGEEMTEISEAKKRKCSPGSGAVETDRGSTCSLTADVDGDVEVVPEASGMEASEIMIDFDKAEYSQNNEVDCSLAGGFTKLKTSVNISAPEEFSHLIGYNNTITTSNTHQADNDVAVLTQQIHRPNNESTIYESYDGDMTTLTQQSIHEFGNVDNRNCSGSTTQTNSIARGHITPNNRTIKVLRSPSLTFYSLPTQTSLSGFTQNNNVLHLRSEIPLKGYEGAETTMGRVPVSSRRDTELSAELQIRNHCCEWVPDNDGAVGSPTNGNVDSNELYILSSSAYNGEKTVISKKQNKNEPCKTVVLQPKYVNVVFDRSQKSILGRAKPKEFHAVFEADNISSQYMNMAVKSCVQNTSIEKTGTEVSECKQKIIPALMRIPNGSPIVLRNNNVRKVTLIKPESIVKPNIAKKNSNDRINLNGCAPSGTPENTSQQLSPDPSAGTHEIIRQELSPDASNKTHDFHKIISNISPVLYNMSNTSTRNKKFIVEVTNQEKMTSNFQRSTKNLDDTEASREPPINSDTSVTTDFQNKSFDTMRLNVVPRYAHSTKPQPLLPAPSVQNTRSVLSIPSGQHSRPLLPTPTVQNAYLVTGFPPNQYVRLVKAPNYSGRSRPVYVSHQPTGSSSRYSSYQPLQSFIASGQNTRHDIEGHLIRSDILGSQSVRPTVVVNQFNTGRGICTINPGIRQPSSLLSTNTGFQYGPSASVNSVRFGGRFYSGPNSRLSRIQTPPGRRVL